MDPANEAFVSELGLDHAEEKAAQDQKPNPGLVFQPLRQAQQIEDRHAQGQKNQGQEGLQAFLFQHAAHIAKNPGQPLHAEQHEYVGADQQERGLLDLAG